MVQLPRAEGADIGMLLEGTFPYVSGGVSSWVNQMIRAFPQYRFALVFIGSQPADYGEMKYQLPENVVHLETHYIHSPGGKPPIHAEPGDAGVYAMVGRLHDYLRAPKTLDDAVVGESLAALASGGKLSDASFLYSRASWDYTTEQYRRFSLEPSFIDYFWTVRIMHQPLWMLTRIAENFIPVRAYHTVSTGYAGFLATVLKRRTGRPLLLSEHGIYTKERKIDLFQSEWIKDNRDAFTRTPPRSATCARCGYAFSSRWGACAITPRTTSWRCTRPTGCARSPTAPRPNARATSPTASICRGLQDCATCVRPVIRRR